MKITWEFSPNRLIDHSIDQIRSNQSMIFEKLLLQNQNKVAPLLPNLKYKQILWFQIQVSAILKTLKIYFTLKLVKHYLRLVLLWVKFFVYECKIRKEAIRSDPISQKNPNIPDLSASKKICLKQLNITFIFGRLQHYQFRVSLILVDESGV